MVGGEGEGVGGEGSEEGPLVMLLVLRAGTAAPLVEASRRSFTKVTPTGA